MIANNSDTYTKQLTEACMEKIKYKLHKDSLKAYKTLMVYGVAKSKNIDLVIHPEFRNVGNLVKLIKSKAPQLQIHVGEYGDLEYDKTLRIGLGYNIRENEQALCKKIITAAYLSLNDAIDFGNN